MSSRHKCFCIQYQDFLRKLIVKYWRMNSMAAARTKALNQGDCRNVVSVTEITEEQYAELASTQRCQHQFLRVSNRPPPKRIRNRRRAS